MKFISAVYKKGRVIMATYHINDGSDFGKVIKANLIIVKDVLETDEDILCLSLDNPKELLKIPNISENIIETPVVLDQSRLNFMLSKLDDTINMGYKYN